MEKPEKKVCTKCGEEKPVEKFFVKKTSKDGFMARCKSCETERKRRYREENKEKIAASHRRYSEKNKEKIAAFRRRWGEENNEKVSAYRRRWCEENKEKNVAFHRRYREENKEKIAASNRRYREENKEKIAASNRRYYEALPDAYVKKILDPIRCTHIPQPLIEAKRFYLRIVRELRKD